MEHKQWIFTAGGLMRALHAAMWFSSGSVSVVCEACVRKTCESRLDSFVIRRNVLQGIIVWQFNLMSPASLYSQNLKRYIIIVISPDGIAMPKG